MPTLSHPLLTGTQTPWRYEMCSQFTHLRNPFNRPELSSPARKPTFSGTWTLTTHLTAACYLRTTPLIAEPEMPPLDTPKDERKRLLWRARTALDEIRMSSKAADAGRYPRILWNCVNRYVRKDLDAHNRTGLTLAFFHANGFPKEVRIATTQANRIFIHVRYLNLHWPTYSYYQRPTSSTKCGSGNPCNMATQHSLTRVLCLVFVSGELFFFFFCNFINNTYLVDGRDSARDITNFLLHFMPTSATNTSLPTHLSTRIPS